MDNNNIIDNTNKIDNIENIEYIEYFDKILLNNCDVERFTIYNKVIQNIIINKYNTYKYYDSLPTPPLIYMETQQNKTIEYLNHTEIENYINDMNEIVKKYNKCKYNYVICEKKNKKNIIILANEFNYKVNSVIIDDIYEIFKEKKFKTIRNAFNYYLKLKCVKV